MSNSTKIKICGLTRQQDIEVVNEVLPDDIGFVFWERSKRDISPEKAADLKAKLDKRIKAVGVFVDADIDFVYSLIKCGTIDIAQLHGNEDEEYIKKLREKINSGLDSGLDSESDSESVSKTDKESEIRIIKAFNVNNLTSFDEVEKSFADFVMLDSGKGSGVTFDWDKIQSFDRPFFLAGGLGVDNVEEVIEKINPYAVDVSSGVETDGVKDREKIVRFVQNVRG